MPESWCWDIPLGVKCSANGKHSLPLTCGGMPASIGSVTWSFFIPISHIHSNSQTQVSGRRAQAHSTTGLDLSVMKVNDGLIDEYLVILTAEGETAAEGWSGKGGFVKLVEWSYIRGRVRSHGRHHLSSGPTLSIHEGNSVIISLSLSLCMSWENLGKYTNYFVTAFSKLKGLPWALCFPIRLRETDVSSCIF